MYNLVAQTKLRFFPRDIGLWRKEFTWNGISEPSRVFNGEDEFREFCKSHGVRFDDLDNPFLIEPCHFVWGKKYIVKQWTVIGWLNYEN
jgi:hypothetical protein